MSTGQNDLNSGKQGSEVSEDPLMFALTRQLGAFNAILGSDGGQINTVTE